MALQPVAAAVDAEREPRGRAPREVERRFAPPAGPAAVTGDREIDRPFRADQRRDHPVRRRDHPGADIEPVAVGLGIEAQGDPVPAIVHHRRKLDQRPARTDVGLAREPPASRPPADPGTDLQPADRKLADVDVEARKDRAPPRRRLELWNPDQGHPVGSQAVDVQRIVEPRAGRPVELDVGRGQEDSAAVRHRDVPQLRLAEDRAVDPADADLEARGGLQPRDPVDDEPVPRRRVEQDEPGGEQQEQRDEQGEQLIRQPPQPVAPEPRRDRRAFGGERSLGHRPRKPAPARP